MKIESLEMAIIALNDAIKRMPNETEIKGLNGDVGNNFRQLSDAISDIEDILEKMKTAKEVRKLFGEK